MTKTDSVVKRFAARADQSPVASVQLTRQTSFGYSVAGVAGSIGSVSGDEITYPDVRPGADLKLRALPGGVKEAVVLKSKDAPTQWEFPLVLEGLTASMDAGSVVLKDKTGSVAAVIPPGFMEDSKVDPRSGDGVRSYAVAYELLSAGGRQVLRVTADSAWVRDPARVFPIEIDPTTESKSANGSTWVQSPYTNDHSGAIDLRVGTFNGGTNKSAAYLKFDNISSELAGNYIMGAKLFMYETYSYSCNARPVYVHAVTEGWSLTGNKTYPGPGYGAEIANASFAAGYDSTCHPSGKWQGIDLGNAGRDLVHGWTHGAPNNGLTVRASETDTYGWKKFASKNTPNAPYLDITYTPYWATYQVGAMSPNVSSTSDGKMQVTVTNHGRDTWTPTNNYKLNYRLWDGNGVEINSSVVNDMPHNVAPGQSATINATVKSLAPGSYTLRWDMDYYGYTRFSWTGAPMSGAVTFTIPNQEPVIDSMSPPSNFTADTLTPILAMTAHDRDNWPNTGLAYHFAICDGEGYVNCTVSDWLGSPMWTVPAGRLRWGQSYVWHGQIGDWNTNGPWSAPSHISPRVPQPSITSHLARGSAADGALEPGVGNYTASATDAVTGAVGPDLSVVRTYNSLDSRRALAFGAGWASRYDTALAVDGDGSGNVVVTYPTGRQSRFGKNSDGSFGAPPGSPDVLVAVTGGWTLRAAGPTTYTFNTSGKLTKISDAYGREQRLDYDATSGRLATATDVVSGRAIQFTWTGAHVTRVTTSPGVTLAWNYTYSGDKLTQVCDPTSACTTYDYANAVHYPNVVLDANPNAYWRLNPSGSSTATNSAPISGPTANGTFSATTTVDGPITTTASFDGVNSHVRVPDNTAHLRTHLSVELWFRTSATAGGVLFSTANNQPGDATPSNGAMPVLYVGTDGKLYGHFWNGQVAGIVTPTAVNNGAWHHVVLTGARNTQTLYLDGAVVGTQAGDIANWDPYTYIGMGPVMSNPWPAKPTDNWGHFAGQISDVSFYHRPLPAATVTEHFLAAGPVPVLTKITRPGGAVEAAVTYEPVRDRVDKLTDANGGQWTLNPPNLVSTTENTVRLVSPTNVGTTYTTNPSRGGRVTKATYDGQPSKAFAYDAGGFVNEIIDENGNAVSMVNDNRGNVLSKRPCRASESCYTTYQSYYLNPADALDPRNNRVTEHRDGRSANETDNTYLTTYTYTATGNLLSTATPGADASTKRTTSYTYTTGTEAAVDGGTMPPGLPLTATKPGGGVTRYAYAANGDLRKVTDPAGLVTTSKYDGLGRAVEHIAVSDAIPAGAKTTYVYDGMSRVTEQVDPAVTNEVTGVAHQQRIKHTYNPSGTPATSVVEDVAGNDPARTVGFTYDAFGRTATVTDPMGGVTRTEYDTSGARTKLVDAGGTEYTYTYEPLRHLPATTTVKGFTGDGTAAHDVVTESNAYDPAGRLASRTDAMGRTIQFRYYADNLLFNDVLKDYTDPITGTKRAQSLHDHYYTGGFLWQTETWGGLAMSLYTRDPAGRITEEKTVDQQWSTGSHRWVKRTYDADDNVTSVVQKSPQGVAERQVDYTYDALGRELTSTQHDGTARHITRTTRDQRGLELSTTDARNNVTTYRYDATGLRTKVTQPQVQVETNGAAATAVAPTMSFGFNTFGELSESVDANGNRTTTTLDKLGRPTSVTQPAYTRPDTGAAVGGQIQFAYDGMGRVLELTDAAGAKTTFAYDQLGNQTRRTDPLLPGNSQPGVWTATYDPLGEQLKNVDPTGATNTFTYDELGRKITETVVERVPAPTRNLTTRYRYDKMGGLAAVTTPDNRVTTFDNDGLGRPLTTVDAAGKSTKFTYDGFDHVTSTTDPLGNKVTYGYDGAARVKTRTELNPAGQTLRTLSASYDAVGNQVSTTDGTGVTTTNTFDALNRLRSVSQPIAAGQAITTSWGYDAAGHVTRTTDGNGNNTVYTINSRGRTESTVEPATTRTPAAADRTYTASYDGEGRLVTMVKPGGVKVVNAYDPLGNLVRQTGTGAAVSTQDRVLGRDLNGRVTSASAPTGTNTYTYDDRGNPVTAGGPGGTSGFAWTGDGQVSSATTTAGTTAYTYDTAGRLATAVDPLTGTTSTFGYDNASRVTSVGYGAGKASRSFGYDNLNRLATDTTKAPAGTVTSSISYAYDNADRLTGKTTTGLAGAAANTYGYDQAGRLTSWNNGTTTTAYGWDGAGNRTSDGLTTSTYDQRNQLLTRGTTTYAYTARGTLSSSTNGTTTTLAHNAFDELASEGTATYNYDALGRLANRNGTVLTYAGPSQDIAGDGTGSYTYLPNGTPLGVRQGSLIGLAIADRHGDLVAVTDPANGTATASRAYDPFGERIASAGTQPALGFQHQYTDPTTGSVNMGARWYRPTAGGFGSRDTAVLDPRDRVNANRHGYVGGDPLGRTDPTGHTVCAVAIVTGPAAPAVGGACVAGHVIAFGLTFIAQEAAAEVMSGGTLTWGKRTPWPRPDVKSNPRDDVPSCRTHCWRPPAPPNTPPNRPGPWTPPGPAPGKRKTASGGGGSGGGGGHRTPQADENKLRVILNALTPHTKPGATTSIAESVADGIAGIEDEVLVALGLLDPTPTEIFNPQEEAESAGRPRFDIDQRKQTSQCESDANGEYFNDGRECFYRAMSAKEFSRLLGNGRLQLQENRTELFATRNQEYSAGYLGSGSAGKKYTVLVEFELHGGSTMAMYDPNVARRGDIPDGPRRGWHNEYLGLGSVAGADGRSDILHVKAENPAVSYGFRKLTIDQYFNANVVSARVIGGVG
ncbi:LamG-like jellyroll fold domain-containing protein [Actinokineospora sp. HUAS TT18]|uniref:LamG-like jellyroll fold domain-containing protein n=1 Tax=Actinokineospora sp. HUAS TT18 TaxID=3447451 RepID=UPI003F527B19